MLCAGDRGSGGVTAWSRTQHYEHPFRALQIDGITCRDKYVITVIDCFSRWCWLVPTDTKDGENVGRILLENVVLSIPCFPTILRSDRGPEFVNDVIREINRLLGVTHITGSAFHPQSQGMIESLNKKVNAVVRSLVDDNPEDWESRIPYAQGILRMTPLEALGGRSPCEVVTGIKPKLPFSLFGEANVEAVSSDDYVNRLAGYMKETYKDVSRIAADHAEDMKGRGSGRMSAALLPGDLVLVTKPPETHGRPGPNRFQKRTYPEVFRIKRGSGHSFWVEYVSDRERQPPFSMPVNAERLVKISLPTLQLDEDQPRRLEILPDGADEADGWEKWTLQSFQVDGSVKLRKEEPPHEEEVFDLSTQRYRWCSA